MIRSGSPAVALGQADLARTLASRQRLASGGVGTGGGSLAPARAPVAPRRPG
jgi:hypothetical protein